MFGIRKYLALALIMGFALIPAILIQESGFERIERKLITIEPKDETSVQYAVEEKHSAPVSTFFGLSTRMAYYVVYADGDKTKDTVVEESLYHKITDIIYVTPTSYPNPGLVILYGVAGSVALAAFILAAKDLNLGAMLRSLIKR